MRYLKYVLNRFPRIKQMLKCVYSYFYKKKQVSDGKKIYMRNRKEYERLNTYRMFEVKTEYNFPIYTDRFHEAGTMGCYFWQDWWAARHIFEDAPEIHYDIGSRIDGFVAHLASFRDNIKLIDVRPLNKKLMGGVEFIQADATNLAYFEDESMMSLSALCSLEHFGLGRYGDQIDPDACFKAFNAIKKKLKVGGKAYISVPVGFEHLEFDAHRVFYAETIINAFKPMRCIEYSCVERIDDFIEENVPIHKYDGDKVPGAHRFGLFCFLKE